jgi:hypothetical protein
MPVKPLARACFTLVEELSERVVLVGDREGVVVGDGVGEGVVVGDVVGEGVVVGDVVGIKAVGVFEPQLANRNKELVTSTA